MSEDVHVLVTNARRCGKTEHKTEQLDKVRMDFLRRYPDSTTITYVADGSVRIERPVKSIERRRIAP